MVLVCDFISAQREGNGLAGEIVHCVETEYKKKHRKTTCLSRFGLGLGIVSLAVSISLSRHAYSKNNALEKDLRAPQASSHSTRAIALHRCHHIHHTYSEIIALQNGYCILHTIKSYNLRVRRGGGRK